MNPKPWIFKTGTSKNRAAKHTRHTLDPRKHINTEPITPAPP